MFWPWEAAGVKQGLDADESLSSPVGPWLVASCPRCPRGGPALVRALLQGIREGMAEPKQELPGPLRTQLGGDAATLPWGTGRVTGDPQRSWAGASEPACPFPACANGIFSGIVAPL